MTIPTSLSDVNRLMKEKPVVTREPEIEATGGANPSLEEKVNRSFDESTLQGVLQEIIHNFRESNKNMEVSILRQPFDILGEKITFLLNGEMQKDLFLKVRPEITLLIRNALQNFKVDVTYEIKTDAVSSSRKLYTSTDKLNYLREKSPQLKELQKRFGLETDF